MHIQYCFLLAGWSFVHIAARRVATISNSRRAELLKHPSDGGYINALIYNPHAECYKAKYNKSYPLCKNKVQHFVTDLLTKKSSKFNYAIDFAAIVYSLGHYSPPPNIAEVSTKCPNPPKRTKDDCMLLYNKDHWTAIGNARRECMSDNRQRRPFIVQGFADVSGFKLLVVAGHYPHNSEYDRHRSELKHAVESAKGELGIDHVLLIADTNFGMAKSSSSLMTDIGASPVAGARTISTFPEATCCPKHFSIRGYDRVIANFGREMQTTLPLQKSEVLHWGARNMHLAVIGSFRYGSSARDYASPAATTTTTTSMAPAGNNNKPDKPDSGSQSFSKMQSLFLASLSSICWVLVGM